MRKMMKCAAAWVLAFAVALTAVPVSYAEDSTGNPEAEYTVPYEAVEEENAVDQESQNDLAGQAQQNPDSVMKVLRKQKRMKLGWSRRRRFSTADTVGGRRTDRESGSRE